MLHREDLPCLTSAQALLSPLSGLLYLSSATFNIGGNIEVCQVERSMVLPQVILAYHLSMVFSMVFSVVMLHCGMLCTCMCVCVCVWVGGWVGACVRMCGSPTPRLVCLLLKRGARVDLADNEGRVRITGREVTKSFAVVIRSSLNAVYIQRASRITHPCENLSSPLYKNGRLTTL